MEILGVIFVVFLIAGGLAYHTLVVASCVLMWHMVLNLHVVSWIWNHPWKTIFYTSGYFLVGAVWSVAKWWFRETEKARLAKIAYDKDSLFSKPEPWADFIKHKKGDPADRYSRSDIVVWIVWWPFSALYTLLNDPIRRLARRIYTELLKTYQRISDHVWKEPNP